MQPLRTPSVPAQAPAFPGSHQVAPHFYLYPAFNKVKAPSRVAYGEVIYPAAQYWVDVLNHPVHGLGSMVRRQKFSAKRLQQRRAFLQLGRILRSPSATPGLRTRRSRNPEPEALASGQVDGFGLFSSLMRGRVAWPTPPAIACRPLSATSYDAGSAVVSDDEIKSAYLAYATAVNLPRRVRSRARSSIWFHLVEVQITEDGVKITPPCGTPRFPFALSMIFFNRCKTSGSLILRATLASSTSCERHQNRPSDPDRSRASSPLRSRQATRRTACCAERFGR